MVVADGVVGAAEADEVGGDEAGALVDELVEGVLAVGAGLTPDDGAGHVVDGVAVAVDALAVALHVELLEVGGEAGEVLVVGEDGVGVGAVAVGVEDADEGEEDGEVAAEGGGAEVLVHGLVAGEHALVVGGADGDHEGEADGGGEGVAAADPIPETEHVGLVDAELLDLGGVGADGDEVRGDGGLAEALDEPGAGGVGVGHRLLGGEGLGGDDEEGLVGLDLAEGLGQSMLET